MSTLRHFHAKLTASQSLTGSLHLRKGFWHTPQLVTIKTVGPQRVSLSNRQNYYDVLQCEYATAANKIISQPASRSIIDSDCMGCWGL